MSSMNSKTIAVSISTAALTIALAGCRTEQHVAANAVSAEQRAQAASTERDRERAVLAKIALPVKSRYVDVHEPGAWSNPFISVDAQMVNLRVTIEDANTSQIGVGGLLRPSAARRRELQLRQKDLVEALMALPPTAWPYGRVVAIEESPLADRAARPAIRRQIETVIQQLNDLGVVVDEWPAR